MKEIKVARKAELVTIDKTMSYEEVVVFLKTHNPIGELGTAYDLFAYREQHPSDLGGKCTAAIGSVQAGKCYVFDDLFEPREEDGHKQFWLMDKQHPWQAGTSFIITFFP